MTKSTITREESVQAVFDLKVGYRLGFADLEILKRVARMALAAMDSSESVELPLDYLQGHKDGLEWAAQLAEANHPETGDWLYDDPIELAKAIRKGPDMPPVQPVADSEPAAEITEDLGRLFVKIHYPTTLKAGDKLYRHAQPASVVQCPFPCGWDNLNKLAIQDAALVARGLVEGELTTEAHRQAAISNNDRLLKVISACRAAMLAAAPQSPGIEPATVPGKWIPVSERMPEVGVKVLCFPAEDEPIHAVFNGQLWLQDISWSNSDEPIDNVITCNVTHWVPLPASPQEVK
ncbi:Eaa1 [Klebsiella pneumoniae]|nr:Eaa1 [Klebsiella pneumoniae]